MPIVKTSRQEKFFTAKTRIYENCVQENIPAHNFLLLFWPWRLSFTESLIVHYCSVQDSPHGIGRFLLCSRSDMGVGVQGESR